MASFTRKAIMASFVKLLEERPLSKVTVKDIVEDCGINRNTFYYHFEDIPSLIEAIVREETPAALFCSTERPPYIFIIPPAGTFISGI